MADDALAEGEVGGDGFPVAGGVLFGGLQNFLGVGFFARMMRGFFGVAQEAAVAHEAEHGFAVHDLEDGFEDEGAIGGVDFVAGEEERDALVLDRGKMAVDAVGKFHPAGEGAVGNVFAEFIFRPFFKAERRAGGAMGVSMWNIGFGEEHAVAGKKGVAEDFGGAFALAGNAGADEFGMGFKFFGGGGLEEVWLLGLVRQAAHG